MLRVADVAFAPCRYGYNWKEAESEKNLLRTHTTAVSSRMLYKLAREGFRPAKFFSVDRVFRNEAIDRTHLAEFHQIEGLVCDRGLTLGDLIGTLHAFFERLGLKKLRFKPAFNPYTEPSMEIFRRALAWRVSSLLTANVCVRCMRRGLNCACLMVVCSGSTLCAANVSVLQR
jgi:hypothetical protein